MKNKYLCKDKQFKKLTKHYEQQFRQTVYLRQSYPFSYQCRVNRFGNLPYIPTPQRAASFSDSMAYSLSAQPDRTFYPEKAASEKTVYCRAYNICPTRRTTHIIIYKHYPSRKKRDSTDK